MTGKHSRRDGFAVAGLALAGVLAGVVGLTGVASAQTAPATPAYQPSMAGPPRSSAQVKAAIASDTYVECNSGGPTAQDAALAVSLQGKLTAKMSAGLSAEQSSCARAIFNNTIAYGYDDHAAVIAICAAIVESSLVDLSSPAGDGSSSEGLFQMIAAHGTVADRENPEFATRWFLDAMNAAYPGGTWETATVGDVDWHVEQPAVQYRDRYQPNAGDAQTIVNAIVAQAPPPPPTPRIGALVNNTLEVKEGGLQAPWNPTGGLWAAGDVKKFEISGNMIAVLTMENHLMVKQGALNAPWYDQTNAGNVLGFSISGESGRVAVILNDGNQSLRVKEGGPQGAWDPNIEDNHVSQVVLSGQWIGVVHDDGSAYVKNGGLDASWGNEQTGNVEFLAIDYDSGRIGVILNDGNGTVWVKDGGTDGTWDTGEASHIQQLELSGQWIGIVDDNGDSWVKEGDLQERWTPETTSVANQSIDYNSGYISALLSGSAGVAWVKDDGIQGPWDPYEENGVSDLQVTSYQS
jgi:hypothetical protein